MNALPLLLLAALAQSESPRTFAVTGDSSLSYRLEHPLHAVDGRSRAVEGRVRWMPDGRVQVMIRARVDSFDSGNSNRDAHMLEVMDAAALPWVTLKAVAEGVRVDAWPAERAVRLRGELDLHGVARPLEVEAKVRFVSPDRIEVEAGFAVSLTAHRIERPKLLFMAVEDLLAITARLSLTLEPPRPDAGEAGR